MSARCVAFVVTFWLAAVAAGSERRIEKEVTVAAPRADVWHAWSTTEGVTGFAPQAAKIEMKPGGFYEWYFAANAPEGKRGGEGCRVLAFEPGRLLAFSWNAPPSIPTLRDAGAKTQVFIRLDDAGEGKTRVRLSHLITEIGRDWDKYHAYFDKAWSAVLNALKQKLEMPGRTASKPAADSTLTLVQIEEFDVSADELWQALTDPAVARRWLAPQVEMDLRPGGVYHANYDPTAKRGDPSWILRDVLAYDPGRLIATLMKRAPETFPHKDAIEGTQSILAVEPLGDRRSRFRLVMTGLPDNDAGRQTKAYFEKTNPMVFVKIKEVLKAAP